MDAALKLAGQKMSNICYNLAQRTSNVITDDERESMAACQKEWDEACRAQVASQVLEIWVLTREINEYDQDGEYFVNAWIGKPTAEQLRVHIPYENEVQKALEEGGGRVDSRDTWYHLRKIEQP